MSLRATTNCHHQRLTKWWVATNKAHLKHADQKPCTNMYHAYCYTRWAPCRIPHSLSCTLHHTVWRAVVHQGAYYVAHCAACCAQQHAPGRMSCTMPHVVHHNMHHTACLLHRRLCSMCSAACTMQQVMQHAPHPGLYSNFFPVLKARLGFGPDRFQQEIDFFFSPIFWRQRISEAGTPFHSFHSGCKQTNFCKTGTLFHSFHSSCKLTNFCKTGTLFHSLHSSCKKTNFCKTGTYFIPFILIANKRTSAKLGLYFILFILVANKRTAAKLGV